MIGTADTGVWRPDTSDEGRCEQLNAATVKDTCGQSKSGLAGVTEEDSGCHAKGVGFCPQSKSGFLSAGRGRWVRS